MFEVCCDGSLPDFRMRVRTLLGLALPPEKVLWRFSEGPELILPGLASPALDQAVSAPRLHVSREFLRGMELALCHRDPSRFDTLYRILWRIDAGERALPHIDSDPLICRFRALHQQVARDAHKAKAFIRFREIEQEGERMLRAWHRPDHRILRIVAPFFARRYPNETWLLTTPFESAAYSKNELRYGPGQPSSEEPEDAWLDSLWCTYYAAIFNRARIKTRAMESEMPKKHWKTLPETKLIPGLLDEAETYQRRKRNEAESQGRVEDFLPSQGDLVSLAHAAESCRGCELYKDTTQTVFGQGSAQAKVVLVGEQPGDVEDRQGAPFVGPAGKVLDRALAQAGAERSELYLTNAVKHFRHELRGKRRLHLKPTTEHVSICRAWLEHEIRALQPRTIVCLGLTAARSVLGTTIKLGQERGRSRKHAWAEYVIPTWHPSAILRAANEAEEETLFRELVEDLRLALAA